MQYPDEQIRPVAEKLRVIYDELGFRSFDGSRLSDDEIWYLAIEHLEIHDQIGAMANKEVV
jgi:hypothetical protein